MANITLQHLRLSDIENAKSFVAYLENWNLDETTPVDIGSFLDPAHTPWGFGDYKTNSNDSTNPNIEYFIWVKGGINAQSKEQWEEVMKPHIPTTAASADYNNVRQNGVLTLFQAAADLLATPRDSNFNILKEILGEETYNTFLEVDVYGYFRKTISAPAISISVKDLNNPSASEQRAVTYLDFLAFIYKFPHIYSVGEQRDNIIQTLENGNTVSSFSATSIPGASSQFAIDMQRFAFQSSAPLEGTSFTPPTFLVDGQIGTEQIKGDTTHYVRLLSTTDKDAKAVLRSGYPESDAPGDLSNIDIYEDEKYLADQSLFTGASEKLKLPPLTQVLVTDTAQGKLGLFHKVVVPSQIQVPDIVLTEGWIDSRVLIPINPPIDTVTPAPIDDTPASDEPPEPGDFEISEGEFIDAFSIRDSFFPTVDKGRPNSAYVTSDWKQQDECHPFYNEKTQEYWLTFEQPVGSDMSDVAEAGLRKIFDFYNRGHRLPDWINYNTQTHPAGNIKSGFLYGIEGPHSTAAADGKAKYVIKVKARYLDHPKWNNNRNIQMDPDPDRFEYSHLWLLLAEQSTLETKTLLALSGDPILTIETDKIEARIKTLKTNLDEFNSRKSAYEAEGGSVDNFPDYDKIKERLENFVPFLKQIMSLNGRKFDKTKNDIIEIGFDKTSLIPLYVAHAPATEPAGSDRTYTYLNIGRPCWQSLPNKDKSVFANKTAAGYLLYSKQIDDLFKNREKLDKDYSGTKLNQKFTIPTLVIQPSVKKSETTEEKPTAADSSKKTTKETEKVKKSAKTADDVATEDTDLAATVEEKKTAVKDKVNSATDNVMGNLNSTIDGALTDLGSEIPGDAGDVIRDVLYKINIREFLIRAAMCLKNRLPLEEALNAATTAILKAIPAEAFVSMIKNQLVLSKLKESLPPEVVFVLEALLEEFEETLRSAKRRDPEYFKDREANSGGAQAKNSPIKKQVYKHIERKLKDIFDRLIDLLKEQKIIQDLLKIISDAAEIYNSPEFQDTVDQIPGARNLLTAHEMITSAGLTELTSRLTLDQDGIVSRGIEVPSIEIPTIEYSDDPLAPMESIIKRMVKQAITQAIVSILKMVMEEALRACETFGIADDDPLASPDFNDIVSGMSDEEVNSLGSEAIANLIDLIPSTPEDPLLNMPGTLDMNSLFNNAARANDHIETALHKINPSGPITVDLIIEMRRLLDYLSDILLPTEICSLFSYSATSDTLIKVLNTIQDNSSLFNKENFTILNLFIKTTDDVAKYFAKLGQYIDTTYCRTTVKDISLITLMCEKSVIDEAYCQALIKKGFTSEQCKEILAGIDKDNREKLEMLEEILRYGDISDFFQSNLNIDYCRPGGPVDNPYINSLMDRSLETIFTAISQQFTMEVMAAKDLLIQEETQAFGGETIRYPVVGRDCATLTPPPDGDGGYLPITGSSGTPSAGLKLFEADGSPVFENFPKQDKIVRKVAARLAGNFVSDTSNILKDGIINVQTEAGDNSQQYKKFFSTIEIGSQFSLRDLTDLIINVAELEKKVELLNENWHAASDSIDDITTTINTIGTNQALENQLDQLDTLQSEIDDERDLILQQINAANEQNASIQSYIEGQEQFLNTPNQTMRMVEYQVPKYKFFENNGTDPALDYNSFAVMRTQTKAPNISTMVPAGHSTFSVADLIQDQKTYEQLQSLYVEAQGAPYVTNTGVVFENNKNMTIPEIMFAKMIGKSLTDEFPSAHSSNYLELEKELASIHKYHFVRKEYEIFNECRRSRLFNINKFANLILGAQSEWAAKQIICNGVSPNVDALNDGMLDFDSIKRMVKDYYKKIACEALTRGNEDIDPFDEAIQYGLLLVYIRLTMAEIILRSLFFFSRFSIEESLVDSGVFLSIVLSRLEEGAKLLDSGFMDTVRDLTLDILKKKVESDKSVKVLANTIIYDDNPNASKREFTNFSSKKFNLADLDELKLSIENIQGADLAKLTEIVKGAGFNLGVDSIHVVLSKYQKKFETLAIKSIINDNIKILAPRLNKLLLDKDRQNTVARYLLASQHIYDVPSRLLNFASLEDETKLQDNFGSKGDFPLNIFDYSVGSKNINRWGGIKSHAEADATLFSDKTIILDLDTELEKFVAAGNTNKLNISIDAYDNNYSGTPYAMASFYDAKGALTHLGEKTKDGGFILQKYVRFNYKRLTSENLETAEEEVLWLQMLNSFKETIGAIGADIGNEFDNLPENDFIVSYKNFDYVMKELVKVFDEFEPKPTFSAPSLEEEQESTGNSIGNDVQAGPGLAGSMFEDNAITSASSGDEMGLHNTALKYLFSEIKYGIRLVYIAPHSLKDVIKEDNTELETITEEGTENIIFPFSSEDPNRNGTFTKLIEGSIRNNENQKLQNKFITDRAYKINELVPVAVDPTGENSDTYSELAVSLSKVFADYAIGTPTADNTDLFSSLHTNFKTIKPLYIVPIRNAFVEASAESLLSSTFSNVKNVLESYDTSTMIFSDAQPLVEKFGANAQSLVPELFKIPEVQLFDDFIFPTKSLLNFGMLHQAFFPYSNKYNFDKLFLESKRTTASLIKNVGKKRNDWSAPTPLLGEDAPPAKEDFNDVMTRSLAFASDSPIAGWIRDNIKKYITRYVVKQLDPALAKAMEIQEENGWPDSKLMSILLDPFGIRPTPIFPPFFPFFGDPTTPVTWFGLLYAGLNLLPVNHPVVEPPTLAMPTADDLVELDFFASEPEDDCEI